MFDRYVAIREEDQTFVLPQRGNLKAACAETARVAMKRLAAGNNQSPIATFPRGRREALPGS